MLSFTSPEQSSHASLKVLEFQCQKIVGTLPEAHRWWHLNVTMCNATNSHSFKDIPSCQSWEMNLKAYTLDNLRSGLGVELRLMSVAHLYLVHTAVSHLDMLQRDWNKINTKNVWEDWCGWLGDMEGIYLTCKSQAFPRDFLQWILNGPCLTWLTCPCCSVVNTLRRNVQWSMMRSRNRVQSSVQAHPPSTIELF